MKTRNLLIQLSQLFLIWATLTITSAAQDMVVYGKQRFFKEGKSAKDFDIKFTTLLIPQKNELWKDTLSKVQKLAEENHFVMNVFLLDRKGKRFPITSVRGGYAPSFSLSLEESGACEEPIYVEITKQKEGKITYTQKPKIVKKPQFTLVYIDPNLPTLEVIEQLSKVHATGAKYSITKVPAELLRPEPIPMPKGLKNSPSLRRDKTGMRKH